MSLKDRDSRFELLRIISIFIIILHHLVYHAAIDLYDGISVNRIISQFYLPGGKVGVNCFLLISGYYGCKTKFRLSKALRLEMQVLEYTVIFFAIRCIVSPESTGISTFLEALLPTTFGTYWYMTAYIGMFLLSPFLNLLHETISKRQYHYLLCILLFIESVSPTVFRQRYWANDLLWFCMVYLIGAYIRRFGFLDKVRHKAWICLSLFWWCATWGISVVLMFLSMRIEKLDDYVNVFSLSNYSTFLLFVSVCMFMATATMKPFCNEQINHMAKATLGIYLIQSNPFVSSVLWPWIEQSGWQFIAVWPVLCIMITCLVWVVCYAAEFLRMKVENLISGRAPWLARINNRVDAIHLETTKKG